ncbi:hypothetical protein M407DRAFT_240868 [Tulasnella calospora MUT 4182]|uniref:Uncharacterized protein n=1 Tax=Tulasnella calospora MUT 4182 TaxID=1051891 RepID=A0A0C3LJ22_9AGAM|nr:hypothetical protein M407DRAFT_240868 [Tulasnella calospora MUT 4182]
MFASDVGNISRQMESRYRRVRDPEQRWCHWQEEPLSIKAVYTIPEPEGASLPLSDVPTQAGGITSEL